MRSGEAMETRSFLGDPTAPNNRRVRFLQCSNCLAPTKRAGRAQAVDLRTLSAKPCSLTRRSVCLWLMPGGWHAAACMGRRRHHSYCS